MTTQTRFPRRLIIVPAYNEADSIAHVIADLRRCVPDYDIVVIDDGSTDGTANAARAVNVRPSPNPLPNPHPGGEEVGRLIVISLPFNQGIGGAMQTGYRYAAMHGYDVAIQVDGDGQHPASEVKRIVQRLEQGNVNMVVGSRFGQQAEDRGQKARARSEANVECRMSNVECQEETPAIGTSDIPNSNPQSPIPNAYRPSASRMVGIYMLRALLWVLTGQRITDCTSGLRAVDRSLIRAFARWYPDDYPEPEVLVLLHRAGFRVAEAPVHMNARAGGRTSIPFMHGLFYVLKVSFALLLDMLREPWPGKATTDYTDFTDKG